MNRGQIKKLTTLGMLAAVSYALAFLGHLVSLPLVPGADFLTFDPKDITIAFTGFIFGPLAALCVSVVVSFIEMITFSRTAIWGFVMNVLSSGAFACTACIIYRRKRNIKVAALSLVCGIISMAAAMMLWNYLFTPIYMGVPRSAVAKMLIPTFLPFNLIKGTINAVLTFVIYKPLKKALKAARLLEL